MVCGYAPTSCRFANEPALHSGGTICRIQPPERMRARIWRPRKEGHVLWRSSLNSPAWPALQLAQNMRAGLTPVAALIFLEETILRQRPMCRPSTSHDRPLLFNSAARSRSAAFCARPPISTTVGQSSPKPGAWLRPRRSKDLCQARG